MPEYDPSGFGQWPHPVGGDAGATITDIDLRILLDQYDFSDIEILTGYHSRYDRLPAPLVRCTIDYYQTKTRLKGVLDEHGHESPFYSKSKNLLNSLYGMMAQDPVKQSILFEEGSDWLFRQKDEPIEDLLNSNSKRAFLCYQWGVWVTAWARYRLQEGLRMPTANTAGLFTAIPTPSNTLVMWTGRNITRSEWPTVYVLAHTQQTHMARSITWASTSRSIRRTILSVWEPRNTSRFMKMANAAAPSPSEQGEGRRRT